MSIEPKQLDERTLQLLDEDTQDWQLFKNNLGRPLTTVQNIVTELYAHILYQDEQIRQLKEAPRRHTIDSVWSPEP